VIIFYLLLLIHQKNTLSSWWWCFEMGNTMASTSCPSHFEFLLWRNKPTSSREFRQNNKQLDDLVKTKWFASVLTEHIGFKTVHGQNVFLSHDTYDFCRWFSYARKS